MSRGFADSARHLGRTLELAGDELTGPAIAAAFGRARGAAITHARFPDEMVAASPMLRQITALVDHGGLTGRADIPALRRLVPDLVSLETWLQPPP